MTDLLHLRIVNVNLEMGTPNHPDASSYFLESVDGRPVPYRAGQFLTLILPPRDGDPNGHEVRRSYSLGSAPAVDNQLRLMIKRVTNGAISRHLLDTLRVGDVLTCLPPAGRFTLEEDPSDANPAGHDVAGDVVLLGAGSGITPLFGLLKQILYTEPNRRVTLLYSNSHERSIIFGTELDALHQQFPDRFRLIHLLSSPSDNWTGLHGSIRPGRLNNVMLERLLPELIGSSDRRAVRFFVCGPADYMRMVQFTLVFSGIHPEQIRRENFVITPVSLTPPPTLAVDRTVLLRLRNREVEIAVPAYKSILQAALDEGVALPYSCRGGRCSSCAARCMSGRVHMTINDVLTERDLRNGWVLTCTGYPESDGVIIELV